MRLALLTHKVDFQDGQGRVNYEIVRAALDRGDEVTVVAEFCSDDIAQHPRGRFVRMRERSIPTQLARNLYFAEKSARWLRRHRGEFDLVQANGFVTWEPADIVAVHYVHTAWLHSRTFPFHWGSFSPYAWYQRSLTILNGYFERKAFRAARALIAVSGFTRGEVIGLGIPPERVSVVCNGVDTGEFHPLGVGESGERASFHLPEGVPMALFVGDIRTTRKNLDAVLKAMQSLPELHLAVAGKTDDSPYPALAATLGVAERVHFVGKTNRIPALMRSVDLFVFPSRYEAHPLVIMEAMASGLPIVVSDAFGAGDYVGDGGLVYGDPDDLAALTGALRRCLTDPEALRRMGAAARRIALDMQWSRTAAGYLAVYDRLLAERGHA
jgi:glycosyltransferase involved in cell wall biosynthesis